MLGRDFEKPSIINHITRLPKELMVLTNAKYRHLATVLTICSPGARGKKWLKSTEKI